MKYLTLLHVDPSRVQAANKNMHFIMKYTMLLHIHFGQVKPPTKENAIYHEIHDVIAYRL